MANDVVEKLRLQYKLPCKKENAMKGFPEKLSYYVGRTIITRNIISDQIFEQDSSDIFLFTGVDRGELSKLAKDKLTGNSRQELQGGVNVKFMILDQENHFERICGKTSHPVHLLRREENGKLRWIKSKGEMKNLREYIHQKQDELDEEQFGQMCTSQSLPVLICDSPGMGKSVLLTQIGYRLVQLYPDRTARFVVLSELIKLAKSFKTADKPKMVEQLLEDWTGEAILQSKLNSEEETVSIEMLLDGYDEVNLADRKLALEIVQTISKSFKSIRLWITSRPHLLDELENGLNILGYHIQPFDEENQVHFLSSFWLRQVELDQEKVQLFAKQCLKSLKGAMNSTDNDIAGIPLQCLLIGEVYEEHAVEYAKAANSNVASSAPEIEIGSITNLYSQLVKTKFHKYKSAFGTTKLSEIDFMTIHSYLSLELLFPLEHKALKLAKKVGKIDVGEVMKAGILTSRRLGEIRFLHRTFVEYFVAWFVFDKLQQKKKWKPKMLNSFFTIMTCVEHNPFGNENQMKFSHPVICYFLNSMMANPQVEIVPKNLPSKLNGQQFKWVRDIVGACIEGDFIQIFKLFDARGTLDQLSGHFFTKELLLLSIRKASVELVKSVLIHFERHHDFDLETIGKATLREAVKHGKFSILEFLIKEKGLRGLVKNWNENINLVCICAEGTWRSSEEEIKEKIMILQMLVGIKGSLVNGLIETNGWSATAHLLYEPVHGKLLTELVRLGANVLVENGSRTILHISHILHTLIMSPEDYHNLVISIPRDKLTKLVYLEEEFPHRDTPLMSILRRFDPLPETLDTFHSAGADFNYVNTKGDSVLAVAIDNGRNAKTIRRLIHLGIGVSGIDKQGNTPLHVVAQCHRSDMAMSDRYSIIQQLLEKGSDPTALNNIDETPFHIFLENSDWDLKIFRLFKSIWDERSLWTPAIATLVLRYAVGGEGGGAFQDQDFEELAQECELHGADFNWTGGHGNSLLHLAAKNGKVSTIKCLCEKGIDVNSKNYLGESPLHTAASSKQTTCLEVIMALIENGANPMEITDDEENILHFAVLGTADVLKYFLELGGVDVNRIDSFGYTPLHRAVDPINKPDELDCMDKCRLLIQYGADVNIENRWGQTPLVMTMGLYYGENSQLRELLRTSSDSEN